MRATIGKVQDEELTPEERWFVDRFYAGGATFVALAEHLRVNERTVRRMRKRIEELLETRFVEAGVQQAPEAIA